MRAILTWILALSAVVFSDYARSQHAHNSEYVGEERRQIKSLSDDDISELRQGGGWGLAKAAELNGVPGPAHLPFGIAAFAHAVRNAVCGSFFLFLTSVGLTRDTLK